MNFYKRKKLIKKKIISDSLITELRNENNNLKKQNLSLQNINREYEISLEIINDECKKIQEKYRNMLEETKKSKKELSEAIKVAYSVKAKYENEYKKLLNKLKKSSKIGD